MANVRDVGSPLGTTRTGSDSDGLASSPPLQRLHPNPQVAIQLYRRLQLKRKNAEAGIQQAATRALSGSSGALPHQEAIQKSFGKHDVSQVKAHTDGAAAAGATAMGAEAFATGDRIAFAGTPSLHTAAHEAAHIVQQRAGVHLKAGVGQDGDVYEQHADAVADRVVRGESAERLLDEHKGAASSPAGGGIQHKVKNPASGPPLEAKDLDVFMSLLSAREIPDDSTRRHYALELLTREGDAVPFDQAVEELDNLVVIHRQPQPSVATGAASEASLPVSPSTSPTSSPAALATSGSVSTSPASPPLSKAAVTDHSAASSASAPPSSKSGTPPDRPAFDKLAAKIGANIARIKAVNPDAEGLKALELGLAGAVNNPRLVKTQDLLAQLDIGKVQRINLQVGQLDQYPGIAAPAFGGPKGLESVWTRFYPLIQFANESTMDHFTGLIQTLAEEFVAWSRSEEAKPYRSKLPESLNVGYFTSAGCLQKAVDLMAALFQKVRR